MEKNNKDTAKKEETKKPLIKNELVIYINRSQKKIKNTKRI